MAPSTDPSPESPAKTVRLRISGRVQGVGYRMWAEATARRLRLTGWVRNLTDGSVESLAQGQPKAIESFIAACRKGPALGQVSAVDVTPETVPFEGAGFEQWATSTLQE